MERYLNVTLSADERAEDLLSRMSLEEKLRQIGCTMVLPMLPNEVQDIKGGIGSAIIMGGDNPANELQKVQEYIIENSPHKIPALFHGEALSGPNPLLGGSVYPISIGLGASFEPEVVEEMANFTRRQMVANGIRHALSPVADLSRDLRWGRTNETYGNDPTLSAAMMVSFVKGLQGEDIKNGVAATGKHFLGYSQTEGGLNGHKTMLTRREIREQYAKPFEAAIQLSDIKSMMNSYSAIDGLPVCANKEILTDLLRDELGFDGLVVSDYGSIAQLLEPYKMADDITEAGIKCLEAGLDVECPARTAYGAGMTKAVKEGRISMNVIDRSVKRMLKLKFELGLFENPYPRFAEIEEAMDNTEPNKGSHRAALKTVTLMKNEGILPLRDKTTKILVTGPAGNCLRMLFSHYTAVAGAEMMASLSTEGDTQNGFDITGLLAQGEDSDKDMMSALADMATSTNTSEITDKTLLDPMIHQLYPEARTLYEALGERFSEVEFVEGCDYKGNDDEHIGDAVKAAKRADVVILAVGGKNGLGKSATTGEGVDSSSLELPGQQERLMREIYQANNNVIIVHTDARPMVSEWAYENVPAIIEGWLPNTYGGVALAEVICGEYNPAGRTPMDVPRSVGHQPVYHYQYNGSSATKNIGVVDTGYIDSNASVLAPFGYGLSYTTFEYTDFTVEVLENGNARAQVTVKNTGDTVGEEVVQLYGADLIASMVRPIHELIGFKRVKLEAGESKTVIFVFNMNILSFMDCHKNWILEKGEFKFTVGGHSDDVRDESVYMQQETKGIEANKRCFYAETSIIS